MRGRLTKAGGHDFGRSLDEIRPTYEFDESCQGTVPQAIIAFLESTDFEDAIRNAISLGGDSDTLAAITGSIAEAAYGIPLGIKEKALTYLDEPLLAIYRKWHEFIHARAASTKSFTQLLASRNENSSQRIANHSSHP
jgi:ADP-ribosylglycohydrolase